MRLVPVQAISHTSLLLNPVKLSFKPTAPQLTRIQGLKLLQECCLNRAIKNVLATFSVRPSLVLQWPKAPAFMLWKAQKLRKCLQSSLFQCYKIVAGTATNEACNCILLWWQFSQKFYSIGGRKIGSTFRFSGTSSAEKQVQLAPQSKNRPKSVQQATCRSRSRSTKLELLPFTFNGQKLSLASCHKKSSKHFDCQIFYC